MTAARRLLVGSGILIVGYAGAGALRDADVRPGTLVFLVAVLIVHDAVLMPLLIGAGALVRRWCPAPLRPYVVAILLIGASAGAVALPLLIGADRDSGGPR